jgi:hypothetical protein
MSNVFFFNNLCQYLNLKRHYNCVIINIVNLTKTLTDQYGKSKEGDKKICQYHLKKNQLFMN